MGSKILGRIARWYIADELAELDLMLANSEEQTHYYRQRCIEQAALKDDCRHRVTEMRNWLDSL